MPIDGMFTTSEACKRLGVRRTRLMALKRIRLIEKGHTVRRLGNSLLFTAEQIRLMRPKRTGRPRGRAKSMAKPQKRKRSASKITDL